MITKLEFLKDVEGNEYTPYVPQSGKSGVTIGVGVDLGNIGVRNLDLSESLIDKITPFDGLRGDDALRAIQSLPLRLSKEEVDILSLAAIELHEEELKKQFNSKSVVKYEDLHRYRQIVLLSVKYQYGSLAKRTPKFWRFATSNEWESVYYELVNFGDDYPTRRKKEASLLAQTFSKWRETCSVSYWNALRNLESKHRRIVGLPRGPRSRER